MLVMPFHHFPKRGGEEVAGEAGGGERRREAEKRQRQAVRKVRGKAGPQRPRR